MSARGTASGREQRAPEGRAAARGSRARAAASSLTWKHWLAMLLLVTVLVVTFVNLGQWQLRRLDERRGKNATVVAHENAGVVPYAQVFTREIADADQWQKVSLNGIYDPTHQLVVRYRSNDGQTGWEVVTPLVASDGRTILVDRGFKQRQAGTDFPVTEAAPPAGTVQLVGYVRRNEVGKDTATIPTDGSVRLINSDDIGRTLGLTLVNGYVSVLESNPADPGFTPIAPPPLDEGPHLSYALQWFTFSLIAVGGLIVFVRNDLRDRRAAEERRARRAAAAASGGPAPADHEATEPEASGSQLSGQRDARFGASAAPSPASPAPDPHRKD